MVSLDTQVELRNNYLQGKTVVHCVTGSIAAIESPRIARMLRRYGATVKAVMSDDAQEIIHPNVMEWATQQSTITRLSGKVEHIGGEDLVLVAPATLNTISKTAGGIADNAVTALLASALGTQKPVVMVPAMHESLYANPIFQTNMVSLKKLGVYFLEPRQEEGKAKIADIEYIAAFVAHTLAGGKLKGKNVMVVAGPTRGKIDAVRYISNRSSGKLGVELAGHAYAQGSNTFLVYGSGDVTPPHYIPTVRVETPQEMLNAALGELAAKKYDALIFPAAVLDYEPAEYFAGKIKSDRENLVVSLKPTPKLLGKIREKYQELLIVGFKLESHIATEELLKTAYHSMQKGGWDIVVANKLEEVTANEHTAYIMQRCEKAPGFTYTSAGSKPEIVMKILQAVAEKINRS